MNKLLYFILIFVFPLTLHAECVVLLHGLLRSDASFKKMEKHIASAGFQVVNQPYPSTEQPIEVLAPLAINAALEKCKKNSGVNFVTHSMGGVLVRHYLHENPLTQIQRVVMLAPPNGGSEVVDKLGEWKLFGWINGPAGKQLGTDEKSLPNSLGDVDFELGVIAGDRSYNLVLSQLIPGHDDGKVSVERTKIAGMADHLILPTSHIFIMKNKDVITQVIHFLRHGKFARSSAAKSQEGPMQDES